MRLPHHLHRDLLQARPDLPRGITAHLEVRGNLQHGNESVNVADDGGGTGAMAAK